jgi:hypothetical protein
MGNEVNKAKVEAGTPELTAEQKKAKTMEMVDKFLALRASKQDLNVLETLRMIDPADAETYAAGLLKDYLKKSDYSDSQRKGLLSTIKKIKTSIESIKAGTMTARGLLILYAGKWFSDNVKRAEFIKAQIDELKTNQARVIENLQADVIEYTAKVAEIDEVTTLRKVLQTVTK